MFLLETGDAGTRVVPVCREDEVRPVDPDFSLPLNQPILFMFYLDGKCDVWGGGSQNENVIVLHS
jgi:hypothetical protein